MKKLFPIFLLPIFVFIACGEEEEDNLAECNDLISTLNSAQETWVAVEADYILTGEYVDGARDLCDAYFEGIIALIEADCPNDLGDYDGWTVAEVEAEKENECDM